MDKFFVVVNGAKRGNWSDCIWSEIDDGSNIFLDNNTLKSSFLRKLNKFHFGNKINQKIKLPFKGIWNHCFAIQPDMLDENNRNFIIFQSNVKFAPSYIQKLKDKKNVRIVLYLPDTIRQLGIADSKKEFKDYCRYYHIDQVFSFDKKDCEEFSLEFFDLYSKLDVGEIKPEKHDKPVLIYIGNVRTPKRLQLLHEIYRHCNRFCECRFYINGVDQNDQLKDSSIVYNSPISYHEVVKKVCQADCLLEVMNEGQAGNTLRMKEAVVYNKKLITNNKGVRQSSYYSSQNIKIFNKIEEIAQEWVTLTSCAQFDYKDDFSPIKLTREIVEKA